ncbi:hypothetical protein Tco_0614137, partial [Tanacetum coccineum]
DLEEDDDEDPKGDLTDYPIDRDDDDEEDEEPFGDDANDEEEEDKDDKEEKEEGGCQPSFYTFPTPFQMVITTISDSLTTTT